MTSSGKTGGARKCAGCGARVRSEAKFCEYCGAELPREIRPKPAAPSRYGDVEARFAALREHRAFPELMRRRPSGAGAVWGMVTGIVVGLFFAGFATFFLVSSISAEERHAEFRREIGSRLPSARFPGRAAEPPASDSGGFDAFQLIPVLFILIGLAIAGWSASRVVRFTNAPLKRLPALVVGERTQVSGGSGNSSSSTSYYVTLEYENGFRREYATDGHVVGAIGEGDVGVAYVKDRHLLAFARVRV